MNHNPFTILERAKNSFFVSVVFGVLGIALGSYKVWVQDNPHISIYFLICRMCLFGIMMLALINGWRLLISAKKRRRC